MADRGPAGMVGLGQAATVGRLLVRTCTAARLGMGILVSRGPADTMARGVERTTRRAIRTITSTASTSARKARPPLKWRIRITPFAARAPSSSTIRRASGGSDRQLAEEDAAGDGVQPVGEIREADQHVAAELPDEVLAVVEGAG